MTIEASHKEREYEAARTHAWEWFKYHATQRIETFRLFLFLFALICTGFVTTVVNGHDLISAMLCILSGFFGFVFHRLDKRNSRLVKIAESYLALEQDRLSSILGLEQINLIKAAESKPRYLSSFSQIFKAVFCSIILTSIVGLGSVIYLYLNIK